MALTGEHPHKLVVPGAESLSCTLSCPKITTGNQIAGSLGRSPRGARPPHLPAILGSFPSIFSQLTLPGGGWVVKPCN